MKRASALGARRREQVTAGQLHSSDMGRWAYRAVDRSSCWVRTAFLEPLDRSWTQGVRHRGRRPPQNGCTCISTKSISAVA